MFKSNIIDASYVSDSSLQSILQIIDNSLNRLNLIDISLQNYDIL